MPREFDKDKLALALRNHPDLQCQDEEVREDGENCDNGVWVYTLAPDLRLHEQVATIRFRNLPLKLRKLGRNRQMPSIKIQMCTESPSLSVEPTKVGESGATVRLTIDEHFDGVTTLVSPSPEEHHWIDVLAISGLGSHPFGSFVHKEDRSMWLIDRLPRDLSGARVLIYGYESGLQHSNSLVQLDDLASPLDSSIRRLLQSKNIKPLLLIGHSLGGLLVKEALIRICESTSSDEPDPLTSILGILLFGAPNQGMDVDSLIPMVDNQPNRFLVESLSTMSSQISKLQSRAFSGVLNRMKWLDHKKCQLFCFYETELSPTAEKVDTP